MRDTNFSAGDIAPSQASIASCTPLSFWVVGRLRRRDGRRGSTALSLAAVSLMRRIPSRSPPEEYRPLQANLNEKKYEESRSAAEALLAKYPNDINALSLVGASYLREGMEKSDAALIGKAGEVIGAIRDLATVKRLQGKYDEGIAILEKARRDFPFAQSLETDLALMRAEARDAHGAQ